VRPLPRSLFLALLVLAAAGAPAPAAPARRVAIQASADLPGPELDRLAAAARARGVEVELSAERAGVPAGFDLLRLSTLPPSDAVRTAVLVFPVAFEAGAFVFDTRAYRQKDEAVRLTASTGGEVIVLGNSASAVLELAGRWLSAPPASDYEVLSGDLTRSGRFERRDGRLVVDRPSDRDRIAQREAFLATLKRRTRGGVVWEFPEGSAVAAAKWEKTASRFVRKGKLVVRVYPDTVTKAALTGSARPADLADEGGGLRVDLDAAAPAEPDLVTPVFAAAGLAAGDLSLLSRPALLAAAGARRAGRWWGRDVKTFAAFTRAAAVDPSVADILASADSLSPVLDVGTAASWLDAGARLESEAAVEKSLAQPDAVLAPLLARWRAGALRQTVSPPKRRPLPAAFLRGVSYAALDELEDSLVSARSREALGRLAAAGFTSIALRPAALMRDPETAEILFVRRGARGETDEGLVRAVRDAHAAGMTAMVVPELLVGGGVPAGRVAMPAESGWAEWFFAYRRFLVHEAVVAEAAGADVFAVGVALTSTEEQKDEWKHVIASGRLATGAPLLYAAASAARAAEVPFWGSLDAIGVQFLEPLARAEKVADAILTEGARAAARPLAELSKRLGKPVVFAQAGYPLVRAAWTTPADGAGRPAAPEDAARAIGAVFRALVSEGWWRGVYWPQADAGSPAAEKAILDGFRALETAAP
jgi:hypothetical protein